MKEKERTTLPITSQQKNTPPFHDIPSSPCSQIRNLHGVPAIVAYHVKIQSYAVKIHRYPIDNKNIIANLSVIYVTWANSMQHHYSRRLTAPRHFRYFDVIFLVCTGGLKCWSADLEYYNKIPCFQSMATWQCHSLAKCLQITLAEILTLRKYIVLIFYRYNYWSTILY